MTESKLAAAMKAAQEMAKAEGVDYGDRRYLPVKDRLEIFRKQFDLEYGIRTTLQFHPLYDEIIVVVTADIINMSGVTMATGHGTVIYGRDEVAKNSPVEAAETFAIGRALACFGLAGSEYASANEMDRVKSLAKPKATERKSPDAFANDMQEKYHGMSKKEAEFRQAVDESFPPSVGKADYFIPADNSPDSLESVYEEIARISNMEALNTYYTLLEESLMWMSKEDVQEIKNTFKSRRKQIIEG